MQGSRLAWLSALPLMAAGSLFAHSLAYRLADPGARERAELLARTGHGYLAFAPAIVAASSVLLLAALAARGVSAWHGRARSAAPAWSFALLPPFGFAVQEHLERLAATGHLPLGAALEPTFVLGLALQLPFALAALLAARWLLEAAGKLGGILAQEPRPPLSGRLPALWFPAAARLPRVPVPASGGASRAPPR